MEKIPQLPNKERVNLNYERWRKVAKPILAYGMYALSLFSPEKVHAQKDSVHSKVTQETVDTSHYDHISESDTLLDIIYNPNGFTFYNSELLSSFESFREQVLKDPSLLEADNFLEKFRHLHSPEYKSALQEGLASGTYTDSMEVEVQKSIDEFQVITDEEELFEAAVREKFQRVQSHVEEIEKQRQWLQTITASEAYQQRLALEFGEENETNQFSSKLTQMLRLRNLGTGYMLSNHPTLVAPLALGQVDPNHHLPRSILSNEQNISQAEDLTAIHEGEHQALLHTLTEYAEKIYREYFSEETAKKLSSEKLNLDYLKSADELAARKRVLDRELERLNIKKYEDEFTEEHYIKVRELIINKQLDQDAVLFYLLLKKEGLMLIMNTVAGVIDSEESANVA